MSEQNREAGPVATAVGHQKLAWLGELSLAEAVEAIASEARGSPGAGSAASLAMSLAAACLSKAVAITLKHQPVAGLVGARSSLADLARAALQAASVDAQVFAAYLDDPGSVNMDALLRAENDAQCIQGRLMSLLIEVAPLIHPSMGGDVQAARVLLEAAGTIVEQIRQESLAARS